MARVWEEPFLKAGPEEIGRATILRLSACRVPCKKYGGLFRAVCLRVKNRFSRRFKECGQQLVRVAAKEVLRPGKWA